jgi:hypothetical protein
VAYISKEALLQVSLMGCDEAYQHCRATYCFHIQYRGKGSEKGARYLQNIGIAAYLSNYML